MCRVFCAMRFLSRIFQLQKLVSKTYKAKLSTADASYVVEGKITLVAFVQKRWFWFLTESGTPQRIEVKKVSWVFSGKALCIWSSKCNQSHCLHKMKENIYCPKHFLFESFNEPLEQVTCSSFTLIFCLAFEIITAFIFFYENACKNSFS